jgi:chromate transporter
VAQLRQSPLVASIVDGVTVGALPLMGLVTWQLCRSAVVDLATTLVALASAVLLLGFRVNSTWLIGAGAGLGLLLRVVRAH